jgi:urease accessory protein
MLLMTEDANLSLLRLLQLSSASLPIGAYAFSQAMESAVQSGWISDSDDARQWLSLQMTHSIASVDAPILLRLMRSLDRDDLETFVYWNAYSLACRESKELRLADIEMGAAMKRLLENVDLSFPCIDRKEICFCAGFAVAAVQWKILPRMALTGLFWSWLENSIAAAVKLVPLGQNAAQRLIGELLPIIQPAIEKAELMDDRFVGSGLPAIGMASAWHESQHTRLFRS